MFIYELILSPSDSMVRVIAGDPLPDAGGPHLMISLGRPDLGFRILLTRVSTLLAGLNDLGRWVKISTSLRGVIPARLLSRSEFFGGYLRVERPARDSVLGGVKRVCKEGLFPTDLEGRSEAIYITRQFNHKVRASPRSSSSPLQTWPMQPSAPGHRRSLRNGRGEDRWSRSS